MPRMRKYAALDAICLPGMTDQYKLNLFVNVEKGTNLKIVFVTEDRSMEHMQELNHFTTEVFKEFAKQ